MKIIMSFSRAEQRSGFLFHSILANYSKGDMEEGGSKTIRMIMKNKDVLFLLEK